MSSAVKPGLSSNSACQHPAPRAQKYRRFNRGRGEGAGVAMASAHTHAGKRTGMYLYAGNGTPRHGSAAPHSGRASHARAASTATFRTHL
jgi:hypothetical protein